MSTQGRGRGRGRFNTRGRGNRDYNNNRSDNNNKHNQETTKFSVGTARQASEYTKIKNNIINQIKMKYKHGIYIGTALEEGKEYDFIPEKPSPLVIIEVDGTTTERLEKMGINKSREIEFQMAMTEYNDKIKTYKENKYKAYSYMWDRCTTQMQQNLEAKADFITTIKNNPFELMKNIEALSYNYQESKYEIAIVADAIRTFVTLKQRDDESLISYMERFKAASKNMIAQKGSSFILSKYIETMEDYDSSNPEPSIKKAFDEYLAYTFIVNSDNSKYGSLIKNLAQQQSLKNTQYPRTLTAASEALNEHKWDDKYFELKKKRDANKRNQNDDSTISTTTTNTSNELELSFAQLENACYCCGRKGHNSTKCFKKDSIPRSEWYINRLQKQEMEKLQQHLQVNNNNSNNDNESVASRRSSPTASMQEWSGLHIQTDEDNNKYELKNSIILDNGSTTSIFSNPRMVYDIKKATKPIELATNAGNIKLELKAIVPGFGEVWYNPKLPTNIFSFSELNELHDITYDSKNEKAFVVHLKNKKIKFKKTTNGLYSYKPNEYVLRHENENENENENNNTKYTEKEIKYDNNKNSKNEK